MAATWVVFILRAQHGTMLMEFCENQTQRLSTYHCLWCTLSPSTSLSQAVMTQASQQSCPPRAQSLFQQKFLRFTSHSVSYTSVLHTRQAKGRDNYWPLATTQTTFRWSTCHLDRSPLFGSDVELHYSASWITEDSNYHRPFIFVRWKELFISPHNHAFQRFYSSGK